MRLVPRVRTLLLAILVLLLSATTADVSDFQLESLEEALRLSREERLDETTQETHHRDKRQLFGGNRRRNRNQNLYPGRNGPSIIYQGLYIPDARFNTFADGIITNMVAELRADNLDPVYFRVNGRGSVTAHENVHGRDNSNNGVGITAVTDPLARLMGTESDGVVARGRRDASTGRHRSKRQLAPTRAYSTALLEGLTNINRRGDVEVQVASNITLVRGRWLLGPLIYRVNFYESRFAVRSLATEIPPIQMDTVTQISYIGADMADFVLGCPLMASLRYRGNVTTSDTDRANTALHNLFQFDSFLYDAARDKFKSSSHARLPLYSTTRSDDGHNRNNNGALGLLGRRRRAADESETTY
ncbi:uncharacterized protein LOC122371582 [Amphibalanus amphitrite]|uniref:uncharacterized protein LOC122371582 n=1 Tax=Amphibalanus amphitrite TaxID=1232801 RepID=UPI001C91E736|nr:uncharacterized protein LOC122371582 [Amphibalanus amphitrite]XP_043203942.1 uncharacterized protein LOC122371582 [Amphibalanus amphitrite]